jgi:hypothetical protein
MLVVRLICWLAAAGETFTLGSESKPICRTIYTRLPKSASHLVAPPDPFDFFRDGLIVKPPVVTLMLSVADKAEAVTFAKQTATAATSTVGAAPGPTHRQSRPAAAFPRPTNCATEPLRAGGRNF